MNPTSRRTAARYHLFLFMGEPPGLTMQRTRKDQHYRLKMFCLRNRPVLYGSTHTTATKPADYSRFHHDCSGGNPQPSFALDLYRFAAGFIQREIRTCGSCGALPGLRCSTSPGDLS